MPVVWSLMNFYCWMIWRFPQNVAFFRTLKIHSNIWPNGIAGMYENGAIKAKALHNLNSCLLKTWLAEYFKTQHSFGHPVLAQQKQLSATHLDLLLETFKQTKHKLSEAYGLDLDSIIFFLSVPPLPEFECRSALELNSDSRLLQDFLASRQTLSQPRVNKRLKLSQSDKDILIDLEQMLTIEPYDYLQVAQDAYLLTLESYFVDSNIYIQKLIQYIAAMAAEPDDSCALSREEIMQRLQQFSANSPFSPDVYSIHR